MVSILYRPARPKPPAGDADDCDYALAVATYLAGALLTLLIWWLDNKMTYAPTEMDQMFQDLTMPGVGATLVNN